jgi:hypothetical protein
MPNYTPIATGAAANASIVNNPLGQLDAAIGVLSSLTTTNQSSLVAAVNEVKLQALAYGVYISVAQLVAWVEGGAYEITAATIDATYGVVSSGTVKWPDGTAGVFTATSINTTFSAIDAYTVTYPAGSHTVTQPAVTRDADGNVTVKPALVVS